MVLVFFCETNPICFLSAGIYTIEDTSGSAIATPCCRRTLESAPVGRQPQGHRHGASRTRRKGSLKIMHQTSPSQSHYLSSGGPRCTWFSGRFYETNPISAQALEPPLRKHQGAEIFSCSSKNRVRKQQRDQWRQRYRSSWKRRCRTKRRKAEETHEAACRSHGEARPR